MASVDGRRDRTGATTNVRRAALRDAAAQQFAEFGYHGTSLRAIAEACDLAQGHLYYYYRSKRDLLIEIIAAMQQRFNAALEAVQESGDTPVVRLRSLLERHVTILCRHRVDAVVSYENLRYLTPDARVGLVASRDRYEAGMCALIDASRTDLDIAPVSAKVLSKVVLGIVNWPYQWYRPGGALSVKKLATTLADRSIASLLAG